ncbi:MAG TPA: twin-arginine translocase TatA/TatE family subunit [Actinomycetota bacterium]
MFNIGPLELMVIMVIALLVVGPKRLPEVGRSIGKSLREFRRAQEEVTRSIRMGVEDEPQHDDAGSSPAEGDSSTSGSEDRTGTGSASGSGEGATDAVRTLGRSLAELRRAREELQRSFRVDLNGPPPAGRPSRPTNEPAGTPEPGGAPEPSAGSQPPADAAGDPE